MDILQWNFQMVHNIGWVIIKNQTFSWSPLVVVVDETEVMLVSGSPLAAVV